MPGRPISITAIAGFLLAATFIASVVALLFPGTFLDRIWELNQPAYAAFEALGKIAGLLLLFVGACAAYAGAGLLKGRNKARWTAVALFAINGMGDAVNLLRPAGRIKSAAGVLVAATFLFCLLRPGVTAFFESRRGV